MDGTLKKAMEQAWAAIRTSEEARRKGEESLREAQGKTEESLQLTQEKLRELGEHLKRADGNFNNRWGQFLENLVDGDMARILKEAGMRVDRLVPRVVVKAPDATVLTEHDLVAANGKEAVVLETKTTLGNEDVAAFLHKLKAFKKHVPLYKSHKVHGAVAFMRTEDPQKPKKRWRRKDEATGKFEKRPWDDLVSEFEGGRADEMAQELGLFVIQSPGDVRNMSRLVNKKGFKPKAF